MAKQIFILLVVAAVVGGVYFFLNYEIQPQHADGRPAGWKIVPRKPPRMPPTGGAPADPRRHRADHPHRHLPPRPVRRGQAGQPPGKRRAGPPLPAVRSGGRAGRSGKEPRRARAVGRAAQRGHRAGRNYDFATCPTQQRDALEHYSAFLFDRDRIDVDRTTVHFVEDRLDRFRTKPLVGSFRVRGPDPAEAFTFTLINVETDPDQTAVELDLLAEAYRAVRDDGRNEDDIILLGDLESDDQHLGRLGKLLGVSPLLSGVPTTVRGTQLLDNILLDRRATCEFTGRVEVVDMMREFELTMPGRRKSPSTCRSGPSSASTKAGRRAHVPCNSDVAKSHLGSLNLPESFQPASPLL